VSHHRARNEKRPALALGAGLQGLSHASPERKTGFKPATFSLASIIQKLTRETVVFSNHDLLPTYISIRKNTRENVVFCEVAKCDGAKLVELHESSEPRSNVDIIRENCIKSTTGI
jgi:hypothetical protein